MAMTSRRCAPSSSGGRNGATAVRGLRHWAARSSRSSRRTLRRHWDSSGSAAYVDWRCLRRQQWPGSNFCLRNGWRRHYWVCHHRNGQARCRQPTIWTRCRCLDRLKALLQAVIYQLHALSRVSPPLIIIPVATINSTPATRLVSQLRDRPHMMASYARPKSTFFAPEPGHTS